MGQDFFFSLSQQHACCREKGAQRLCFQRDCQVQCDVQCPPVSCVEGKLLSRIWRLVYTYPAWDEPFFTDFATPLGTFNPVNMQAFHLGIAIIP